MVNLFYNSMAEIYFLHCQMFIQFGNRGTGVFHPNSQMLDFLSGELAFSRHTVLLPNGCDLRGEEYAS